jgi:flagellar hook-basal body complex protein FliE
MAIPATGGLGTTGLHQTLKLSSAVEQAAKGAAAPAGSPSFGSVLEGAMRSVDAQQKSAASLAQRFQAGDTAVTLEESMIALQKANLSFQAMVQVRNRLVSAYHDVMNMQI